MHIQLQNECSAASIPIQLQERIFNCRQTFAAISLLQVNLKMRGRFAATKWTLQQLSRPLLFPAAKVLADLELQKRPVAIVPQLVSFAFIDVCLCQVPEAVSLLPG